MQCVRKLALYSDVIHLFDWKSAIEQMVVFKMRDSVPSARYSSVCNVLRQWRIWLIPTYRVYRLYDNYIALALHFGQRLKAQSGRNSVS